MFHFFIKRQFLALICIFLGSSSFFSQTLYWVGGSGNFNDVNHWSTFSGGSVSNILPSQSNDVVFDNNSGKGYITVNFGAYNAVKSLETRTQQNLLKLVGNSNSILFVYGNLSLKGRLTFSLSGQIQFNSENKQVHEIDFGSTRPDADIYFNEGNYSILSLQMNEGKSIYFGNGFYDLQNSLVTTGNFINENLKATFNLRGATIQAKNKFIISSEQDFSSENLYVAADLSSSQNYKVPGSLSSSKTFTSVNSVNVLCPVVVSSTPACNGSCTGVLTVSLSSTCTNTPYSITFVNSSCSVQAAAMSYTNIPSVFTITNACACNQSNYVVLVKDGSNTYQYGSNAINFIPNSAILFDNNISPCTSSCNGVLLGSILGYPPFSVTIVSSSATIASFTTATGDYTVNNVCAGSYSFNIIDQNGCFSQVIKTLAGTPDPTVSVNSGSICSGSSFSITPSGAASYTISGGSYVVSPGITSFYTVTGSNGSCPASVVSTVIVSASPTISVSNGTLCAGSSYTINPYGANTYSFNGSVNPVVNPAVTATYSISGTNTLTGCQNFTTMVLAVNDLPTITVNNGTLCSGSAFTLIPIGAGTYTYSGGSNVVSPLSNTTYSVVGTSSAGCVSTVPAIASLTVDPLPIVSVNSGTLCSGNTFTLLPSGAATYSFSSGSAFVTPSTTTNYSVMGISSFGCMSASVAVSQVMVYNLPQVSLSSGIICPGDSYTLIASGATSYSFSGTSFVVSPSLTTTYSATGTSSSGCVSFIPAVATVSVVQTSNPMITSNSPVCEGKTLMISGVSTGAIAYVWAGPAGFLSTSQNIIIQSIATSGTGLYSLTSVFSSGSTTCISTGTSQVQVLSVPVISVNSGSICAGQAFSIVPNGAVSYVINPGNTSVVSPPITMDYTVTGAAANSCTANAISSITVNALPQITASSSNTLLCSGQSVTLTLQGAQSYSFDGNVSPSSATVNPLITTNYSISGLDAKGCVGTAVFTQSVDACLSMTKISEGDKQVNLYPNPNKGEFILEASEPASIRIVNAIGQLILEEKLLAGKNKISMEAYSDGIYFILYQKTSQVQSLKLIKKSIN